MPVAVTWPESGNGAELMGCTELTDWPTQPIARPTRTVLAESSSFVAGGVVAGRYRLFLNHGCAPLLEFWQATDLVSDQVVALTLVDPAATLPVEWVNEILSLTVRLRGLDTPGIAPIREVLHTGHCGVVVGEWVPGGSLREVADTDPAPAAVAAALEPLAMAAEAAHRAGVQLSVDHSARVRISTAGHAVLAFPATLPDATPQTDLRGIGSCLYALLTRQWPDEQEPAPLIETRPGTPYLVSATAAGLVRPDHGIASAATLVTMLRQAARDGAGEADPRVLEPLEPPPPGGYAAFRNFGPGEQARTARRGVLRATIGAAAAVAAAGVVLLSSSLNSMLSAPEHTAAIDPERLGLQEDSPPAALSPPQETVKAGAAQAPVKPVKADVFSTDGRPDNPDEAGRVIDGDTASSWSTDRYYDADPFPTFKEGLGLMLELPAPTTLGSVSIESPSAGTVVQIRSADTQSPSGLADTTEISAPATVQPGRTTVTVRSREPVTHVLVWVSTLGSTDGRSQASISEVTLHPPAPPA